MVESQLVGIVSAKVLHRFLLAALFLSVAGLYWMAARPQIQCPPVRQSSQISDGFLKESGNQQEFQCTPISQSVNESNSFQQERFWYDLVVNQNISVLNQLPSHILRSHGCFWLQQIQIFDEESSEEKVKSLTEIMQSQMEQFLQQACKSIIPSCQSGKLQACGFGCQLHHRAICALLSFTLGIPLIHDTTNWPFTNSWGSMFKTLGSECERNNKTIYLKFYSHKVPSLEFTTLCSDNSCVTDRKVQLNLNQGFVITKELLDLLKIANHPDPFLWYVGQFIRYSLRFNEHMQDVFGNYEKNFTFDASRPVIGIQARRTDKIKEAKNSYHSNDEYIHIVKVYFQMVEGYQDPKTVFVASDDHTVLADIRKSYKLPSWRILGFDANVTLSNPKERNSDAGLISIVRDVHFLEKCDFVACGLSSNVCRLILEIMATQFPNCKSRVYSVDGVYIYPYWTLNLKLKLVPV